MRLFTNSRTIFGLVDTRTATDPEFIIMYPEESVKPIQKGEFSGPALRRCEQGYVERPKVRSRLVGQDFGT